MADFPYLKYTIRQIPRLSDLHAVMGVTAAFAAFKTSVQAAGSPNPSLKYPRWSSHSCLPFSAFFEWRVSEDDELSHDVSIR
jgi:hypothetical protein